MLTLPDVADSAYQSKQLSVIFRFIVSEKLLGSSA